MTLLIETCRYVHRLIQNQFDGKIVEFPSYYPYDDRDGGNQVIQKDLVLSFSFLFSFLSQLFSSSDTYIHICIRISLE